MKSTIKSTSRSTIELMNTATDFDPTIAPMLAHLEQIDNPVTGDRMTILQSSLHSSHEQDKACAKIRFDLPPGAKGSPLHYHTRMTETFTVLSGCLEMEIGQKGSRCTLQVGERVSVPAGMHHSFRNASEDWVTFTSENQPAEGFEQFIRGMFGLAIDGKVNRDGMPTNLLHFVLLLKKADIVLVGLPRILQTLFIGALLQIAQVLGTERSLVKYWNQPDQGEAQ